MMRVMGGGAYQKSGTLSSRKGDDGGIREVDMLKCRLGMLQFGRKAMKLTIKPSDLYFKYRKDTANRHTTKFSGKPDPATFDRDDIYEVVPMLEAVMTELGRDDERTLHLVEEIMIRNLPGFITSRDEVFDFLVGTARDVL